MREEVETERMQERAGRMKLRDAGNTEKTERREEGEEGEEGGYWNATLRAGSPSLARPAYCPLDRC